MEKKPLEMWVEVYMTSEESDAMIVKGLLEAEGIPCQAESTRFSQIPVEVGALGGRITLLVRPGDFERARRVLESARMEPEEGNI